MEKKVYISPNVKIIFGRMDTLLDGASGRGWDKEDGGGGSITPNPSEGDEGTPEGAKRFNVWSFDE